MSHFQPCACRDLVCTVPVVYRGLCVSQAPIGCARILCIIPVHLGPREHGISEAWLGFDGAVA